jgi:hypothetical protein
MPDNCPGKWIYHYHSLEHHAADMMAKFEVIYPFSSVKEKQNRFIAVMINKSIKLPSNLFSDKSDLYKFSAIGLKSGVSILAALDA